MLIRTPAILCLLALPGAVLPSRVDLPGGSLTVHEWGTFTTVAGSDGLPVVWSPLSGPSDLPCFVYRVPLYKGLMAGTVRMETPVIYFYSSKELTISAKVSFPQGLISEWYPRASGISPADPRPADYGSWIEWRDLKVSPALALQFITEPGKSHYYLARNTGATAIQAGSETEKFLFYRGVGRFPIPLAVRLTADGSIVLTNLGKPAMPDAVLFQNRAGRMNFRRVGAIDREITVERPDGAGSEADLRRELERALTAAGLFASEARAMVDTWGDSWFEEGTRLFYILPSPAVDQILPIHIEPKPAAIARVFVGRIEIITPEIEQEVERAARGYDKAALQRRGRFLRPIIDRLAAKHGAWVRNGVVNGVLSESINAWASCR